MWNHSPPKVSRAASGFVPVAERIVRVRPGAQADLAALARSDRVLVLVEDLDVPARHRLAHRALADLHEGEVAAERIGLAEPVEVEHGDAVLVAEPADRLRVERLAGRADPAELLRVALAGVLDRHHRAHRGRGREDVGHAVLREHLELLVRDRSRPRARRRTGRRRSATARSGGRCRPPRPTRPCRGRARPPARRGSRRTPRGRGCSGGRGGCPWPGRWCRTCSRSGPGRRPRCRRSRRSRPARPAAPASSTITSSTRSPGMRSAFSASVTITFGWESRMRCSIPSSP